MAYFLKTSNQTPSKGLYLQIYESFWDKSSKKPKNKSFKTIGYVNDLISNEMPDPIAYWKNEVRLLNEKLIYDREKNSTKMISISPERNIGYTLLKHIYNTLDPSYHLSLLARDKRFHFDISRLIESLIYARCVNPCSKSKTYTDVIPYLYEDYDFSLDQIYEGVEFIGCNYDKVIEIFNEAYKKIVKRRDTSKVYFDCTNFYFEIDREDTLRKKGPSKENRKDPIVSMGLLLDSQQIPLSMHIFPGNESEKPIIRDTILNMKRRYNITGRTVQVADKGLNCSKNIYECLKNDDGYIYSQSIKGLSKEEKEWIKNQYNEMKKVYDSLGNLEYEYKECIDNFSYEFVNNNGEKIKFIANQKRVLTFNPELRDKQLMEVSKLIEKAKTLCASKAKRNEYGECSKYVNLSAITEDGEIIESNHIFLDEDKIIEDKELAGFNLLVTSELDMKATDIYSTYHNLWKIEESFRLMKSQLDARPVFLQKHDSIKGHFLICYLSIFLLRITQYLRFKNTICANKLCDFIRNVKVIKPENDNEKAINLSSSNSVITAICEKTNIPYNNFYLTTDTINKIINYKMTRSH